MKSALFISTIVTLFVFASCRTGKVPFNQDIRTGLSEVSLKKVQFYTSGEIVLYKTKEDGSESVAEGIVLIQNKKDCEKVIIPAGTPCILEKAIDDKRLLFSFEVGDGKFIAFGTSNGESYSLLAKEWQNGSGVIKYANKTYFTQNGDIYLNVILKKINKLKSRERLIKGRRV